MRLVRRFPNPDPAVMLFATEAIPDGMWDWPAQERAQRLRYAVVALCAGIHGVVAWPLAFSTDPDNEAAIERTIEQLDDGEIEAMVRQSAHADWMALP